MPNSGIHLRLYEIHDVRVVKSLGGTVPPPGRNRRRRGKWSNHPTLWSTDDETTSNLPALSLIIDWRIDEGEPVLHLSLPNGAWGYGSAVRVHWRTRLPRGGSSRWTDLRFDGDDGGDPLVIEPAEAEVTG